MHFNVLLIICCNCEFKPNYVVINTISKRVITIHNTIPLLSQQSGLINAEDNEAEPDEDPHPRQKKTLVHWQISLGRAILLKQTP